jgi:hypothetical protein
MPYIKNLKEKLKYPLNLLMGEAIQIDAKSKIKRKRKAIYE